MAIQMSTKHFVPRTNGSVASGAIGVHQIVNAVAQDADLNTTDDVHEGEVVQAVWLEYWLNAVGVTTDTGQFTLIVEKIPANGANPTVTNMLNLQSYLNKKNILYTTQGNLNGLDSQSVPVLRQFIMIPKGKQRFGLGDRFVVSMLATGLPIDFCGMAIYKAKS